MSDPDPEVLKALALDHHAKRRTWMRRGLVAAAVLVLGLAVVWVATRSGPPPEQLYRMEPVTRGDLTVSVTAVGTLQPLHEVEVSSELSGIVAEVFVDHNDVVRAGQPLAILDTRQLEAQAEQADAAVAQALAQLRQARIGEEQARLDRERSVKTASVTSKAQQDRIRLAHESSVASVQLAQAQLQSAKASQRVAHTNLEKAVLRAPTDGVVLERAVDPGQAVVSAMSAPVLFRVAEDLHSMSLMVEIDEAEIAKVHAGQEARFTVAAWPDATFEATVHSVRLGPKAGEQVVIYEAELDVDNREEMLRPGMTATAELLAEEFTGVVKIPSAALRYDPPGYEAPAGPHVWVVEDGEVRAIRVEPGANDGATTAVEGGEALVGAEVIVGAKAGS